MLRARGETGVESDVDYLVDLGPTHSRWFPLLDSLALRRRYRPIHDKDVPIPIANAFIEEPVDVLDDQIHTQSARVPLL
jgi:predicted nucleotidyltransferase